MFRIFRAEPYKEAFYKLENHEQSRVKSIEEQLRENPLTGRPLGYPFLREKKFFGKRLLYLIYEEYKVVFLIAITDKKAQQEHIDSIKSKLNHYKQHVQTILKLI